jgi:Fe-S oxidoreductase
VLDELRDDIRAGVPLVGVEPSCVAVFKDELVKVWPNDEDAQRLSRQTFHLGEFLAQHAEDWEPPQLHRKAIVHEHCHHHATGGIEPDQKLLERMGVDVEKPESGCCGMAGGWGYEPDHYDVSIACAERVLLPKVREAPGDAFVIADGFSCRSQIEQTDTRRKALHLAQVLRLAREHGAGGPPAGLPETYAVPPPQPSRLRSAARAAVPLAAVAVAIGFAIARAR